MRLISVALVVMTLFTSNAAKGGMIYITEKARPSTPNSINYRYINIACFDARNGNFTSCGYDLTLKGLVQPESSIVNNGGHTHASATPEHPVGTLKMITPVAGSPTKIIQGNTNNNYVAISQEIPEVSGKIETELNLRVPPGWYTVSPESCDGTRISWCFNTKVDVGIDLVRMPDNPALYKKVRKGQDDHEDSVTYYGTQSAINNLQQIAGWYNWITVFQKVLSINDMSLIRGGTFDIKANYIAPHSTHNSGLSVDINKDPGIDCRNNKILLAATFLVYPSEKGSAYTNRTLPSWGRYLCETGPKFNNSNNIHIDL